jgi:hypothetical protein
MAFIFSNNQLISFATYDDLFQRDSRVFEANESLTEDQVDQWLSAASARILTQIQSSDWWKNYQYSMNPGVKGDPRLVPAVTPTLIRAREQEFKDLNVYLALYEYILPSVADFGNATSAEVVKIAHYKDAYDRLFDETLATGDWYDFDADTVIETAEKNPVRANLVRVR